MVADLSPLDAPFVLPGLTLNNRWVMAPMTRNRCPDYVPDADTAAYYRRRAEHGVGLIITEATTIAHPASNGYEGVPAFFGEAALAGWRRVVDAVHAAGGRIMPQLWHVGTIRKAGVGPDPQVPGYGPSGITSAGRRKAETLTESDIADLIEAYAQAAADAERLGFDGIELHGAHGYLIDQFFWSVTNERDDAWGGDAQRRSRFALEIIKAVRARVSPRFPVLFRFSQWKQQDYTARLCDTPAALEAFLTPLAEAGVDVFHASTRRFWEPEFEGASLNLAGWTRKLTGKPVITVGSVGLEVDFLQSNFGSHTGEVQVTGLEALTERFARDEFDLVAVGRVLLQDPAWIEKVRQGRLAEITSYSRAAVDHYY